ncbi:MAG: Lrp/AsnC family transcriptional regulator [Candidatus Woesearchaeota archaeon]
MQLRLSDDSGLVKIDIKDRKILSILQHDARISRTSIAKTVGSSKDAVNYRIHNYESNGLIQGYRAVVDVSFFGYDAYHLFLQLKTPSVEKEKELFLKINENKNVRAIIKYSGKYDLQIALIAKNAKDFDAVLEKMLLGIKDYIQSYDVLLSSEEYVSKLFSNSFIKKFVGKDISRARPKTINMLPDKTDIAILSLLSDNANESNIELSKKLKISADSVRRRIDKMRDGKILTRFIPAINYAALGYSFYCVMFNIKSRDAKFKELILNDDNLLWGIKSIGKYNVLAYLCVSDSSKVHETINRLREKHPGNILDYEILLGYEEYKFTYFPEVLRSQ